MRATVARAALMAWCFLGACGGDRGPAPPSPDPGSGPIAVSGRERLEWDQQVNAADLSRYRFAAYVDAARTELPAAGCRATGSNAAVCISPLPAMAPGLRVLELVAYLTPDGVESPRSSPITLMVGASVSASMEPGSSAPEVSHGVTTPNDCAVAPLNARTALVATPDGGLRVMDIQASGTSELAWDMPPDGGWVLRAVAVHPQFARSRLLYLLLADTTRHEVRFAITRYRELAGVLGERAVIAAFTARTEPRRPRLRFGPDGKLYVALLNDWNPGTSARGEPFIDGASAFLLRFNQDGTVATDDSRALIRDIAAVSPSALAWDALDGALWVVDQVNGQTAVARSSSRHAAGVALPLTGGTIPVGLHVIGAGAPGGVEQAWTVLSDGVAQRLERRGDAWRVRTAIRIPGVTAVHDAVGVPDGTMLACGTVSPHGPYVLRAIAVD